MLERQKTKLGARILSDGELDAILPSAQSINDQIMVFRNSIPKETDGRSDEQYEIEQKTNNIGIMGRRGAGKTSILKTFYHKLKTESNRENKKNEDIILPIIVPENMSSSTTLMDVVLGRLKSIVDKKKKSEERGKYSKDCIYSGRASLEQQYNELVKQYCYIKKDYRDILIQQFTTEQNYVDRTKKVFSSDSEFIKLFNQFVIALLQNERKMEENSMMFLFIDDVDLSTNRCMDIVRTLLVYLSNPRIVTFISGDMETFEEELTLEFLRQEEALREDVFKKTYYSVDDTSDKYTSLLERKKTLAYEYLRKIIPPAYRRSIRYWSLEERGNYRITGEDGGEEEYLAKLLVEVSEKKVKKSYFIYKEDGKKKCMGLAFHMFDDTSRGLNNIYNVLQEIHDMSGNETLLYWRLIETMADSKPLYARYKSELLEKIIVLGQERVKIDFANAYEMLYGNTEVKDAKEKRVFTARERFIFYMFIDFASRLFSQEQYDDNYDVLKNKIIQEYISDETIDDRIAQKRDTIDCLVDNVDKKENKNPYRDSVRSILITLLRECDFIFVLHLIRYLGREVIYDILADSKEQYQDKEIAYKIAYALSRTVQAVNESEQGIQNELADLYIKMQDTMLGLLNRLSLDPWSIYGRQLTKNTSIEVGMQYISDCVDLAEGCFWNIENYMNEGGELDPKKKNLMWAEYENRNLLYWIYYEKKLREKRTYHVPFNKDGVKETVTAGLTKAIMNRMMVQRIMNRYEVKKLSEIDYTGFMDRKIEKEQKQIQVIREIDERELWDSPYAKKKVYSYLESNRTDYIGKMCSGRTIFDATRLVEGPYNELKTCYKGSSGKALIYGLWLKLRCVMFLSINGEQHDQNRFLDGGYYLRLEQVLIIQYLLEEFLQNHERIVYGKREVRKLLMEVKELPLMLHISERNEIDKELRERENRFFSKNVEMVNEKNEIKHEAGMIWQEKVNDLCKTWYVSPQKDGINPAALIEQYLGEIGKRNQMYFKYLMQKTQIENMKKEMGIEEWKDIEYDIPEIDYLFLFHSYLRYLQVNDSDAQKAGARAEDIAKLARYMLDSEVKADEKIQNEVYQIISKDMDLTEEEFETLF